jgi:hypothetical protein
MTKRRQVRKVATMVKRLKKNPEDLEQQPKAEAEDGLASEGGWDAQQQATVAAYAHSRGMQPREVLQALVNSMEKTLRKEKGENVAGQTPLLNASQQEEAAGKSEIKPSPGRGGRDLRERKVEHNCVACSKDKRRGFPPKTRWKEEQKEKAKRIERWPGQVWGRPPLCLCQGAVNPAASWKGLERMPRAQRRKAYRCR